MMPSSSGNFPGKACGVHVCGGNGFVVTGPGGLRAKQEPSNGCKENKVLLSI